MKATQRASYRSGFCVPPTRDHDRHGNCRGGHQANPASEWVPCVCVCHTDQPETPASSVVALAQISLAFGRVDRITFHEDGHTPESDTDHTVMLALIGCAFAAAHLPRLDIGLVAQYALVHDLVEVYAGDTPTLHSLTDEAKTAKADREHQALERIAAEFTDTLPWLPQTIASYERRLCPEARYVKALDKLLPKITHILNHGTTLAAAGMSRDAVVVRYAEQGEELREYASDFPEIFDLREALIDQLLAVLP